MYEHYVAFWLPFVLPDLLQLEAWFGPQLGDQRLCSGIGIRLGLTQGSARLTCLGLVLGIGSGQGSARLGSPAWLEARGSAQVSALRTLTLIKVWLGSSRFLKYYERNNA